MRDPEFFTPEEEFHLPGSAEPEEFASPGEELIAPAEQVGLPPEFPAPGEGGFSAEPDRKASFRLSALLTAALTVALVATTTPLFFGTTIASGTTPPPVVTSGGTPSGTPSGTPGGATPGGSDAPAELPPDPYAVSAFPALPNLDPDFAGNYAWANQGPESSEEYLILSKGEESTFLVAGGYYRNRGIPEKNLPGCSYDRKKNLLTLTNFNEPDALLNANLMGNGFTIELVGDNQLGQIMSWGAMYGGSVTFTGSGKLTLNASQTIDAGLLINSENSPSCVMVDQGVTLEVFGTKSAYANLDSTVSDTLYFLSPIHLYGGIPGRGDFDESGAFHPSAGGGISAVMDEETGEMAKHIILSADPALFETEESS